ncbi:MAG: type II toxin-antitoxin system RelE/ParE family toxin [Gammaproteobacteria bacterium]|nr:MAG: type II toxin-antitoxin system RelE/ParE family toxin [Gammaproteobacteria bacterium]
MRVTILESAEHDLENGYKFYEQQSPELGTYFLDTLFSDIDSLAYYGGIHPVFFGYNRLLSKRFPFAIYYKINNDEALVFAVLDCRQKPSWTHHRLLAL